MPPTASATRPTWKFVSTTNPNHTRVAIIAPEMPPMRPPTRFVAFAASGTRIGPEPVTRPVAPKTPPGARLGPAEEAEKAAPVDPAPACAVGEPVNGAAKPGPL